MSSNNNQEEAKNIYGCCDGFRYVEVDESMYPAILQHIKESFCVDEVLGKSLGYTEEFAEDIVQYSKKAMTVGKGVCIAALDEKSGELAGVRISKIAKRDSPDDEKPAYGTDFTKVLDFLGFLETHENVFDKYEVDEIFEFVIVSVSPKYRGRGLATQLIQRSLRLAKSKGLKVTKGIFTGLFSQKIAHKTGFEVLVEVLYKDYKVDGHVVFDNTGEHPSAKWMAKVM